jgi:hypothetical protein
MFESKASRELKTERTGKYVSISICGTPQLSDIRWGFEATSSLVKPFAGWLCRESCGPTDVSIPLVIIAFRKKNGGISGSSKKSVPKSERFFDNRYKSYLKKVDHAQEPRFKRDYMSNLNRLMYASRREPTQSRSPPHILADAHFNPPVADH